MFDKEFFCKIREKLYLFDQNITEVLMNDDVKTGFNNSVKDFEVPIDKSERFVYNLNVYR